MRQVTFSAVSAAAALAGGLTMGCDKSGVPTDPSTFPIVASVESAAIKQVPFKGTFTGIGTAADVPGDRCPVLTVDIHGTGTATHVGSLTTDQGHCAEPTSLAFTDGVFTFTAANGDQLRGTYFGEFVPLDPPLFSIDGHFAFTGGTGRFASATGGGDASGVQNLSTGDATVVLEGTISSVGSTTKESVSP